jgi:hypothetical protein
LLRKTNHSIVSISAMKAELERTRERGFAIDDQESMLSAYCVAVPVLDEQDRPVVAISIDGPQVRFNGSQLEAASVALWEAADAIEEKLRIDGRSVAKSTPAASPMSPQAIRRPPRVNASAGAIRTLQNPFSLYKRARW